jgi:BirA family biotin operon repressor/biotin-[acetyl-CoA-carboxylase] ligase
MNQSKKEILQKKFEQEKFTYFKKLYYYSSLNSTNTKAKELIKKSLSNGIVILADKQTNGRGRFSRIWHSPPGGLYLSLVLPLIIPKQQLTILPLLIAVVIHDVLHKNSLNSTIKWPNDILINSKKIAGILIEHISKKDSDQFLIIGIGINANTDLSTLPTNLHNPTTSIMNEIQKEIDIIEMSLFLIRTFEKYYKKFLKTGPKEIIQLWKANSDTIGKEIKINLINKTIDAFAVDIDNNGFLIIKTSSGGLEKISSGDVEYVREN